MKKQLAKGVLKLFLAFSTLAGLFLNLLFWYGKPGLSVLGNFTLPLTLLIETGLAAVVFKLVKQPLRPALKAVIIANLFTQPFFVSFLWFRAVPGPTVFYCELVIWWVEAVILYYAQHRKLSFRWNLALAFFLNLSSFLLGMFWPS